MKISTVIIIFLSFFIMFLGLVINNQYEIINMHESVSELWYYNYVAANKETISLQKSEIQLISEVNTLEKVLDQCLMNDSIRYKWKLGDVSQ